MLDNFFQRNGWILTREESLRQKAKNGNMLVDPTTEVNTYLSVKETSSSCLLRNTWYGWERAGPAGRSRPLFWPSPSDPPRSRSRAFDLPPSALRGRPIEPWQGQSTVFTHDQGRIICMSKGFTRNRVIPEAFSEQGSSHLCAQQPTLFFPGSDMRVA